MTGRDWPDWRRGGSCDDGTGRVGGVLRLAAPRDPRDSPGKSRQLAVTHRDWPHGDVTMGGAVRWWCLCLAAAEARPHRFRLFRARNSGAIPSQAIERDVRPSLLTQRT